MAASIVELPEMHLEQRYVFESMAVSNKFDNEGMEDQVTNWNVWYLTPRVFEKEAEDKVTLKAREKAARIAAAKKAQDNPNPEAVSSHGNGIGKDTHENPEDIETELKKEIVLSHWDPDLYRSKIWPVTCLFGASFGALHLMSWNTHFPTVVEEWLWRISAFVSIFSIIIFMHFEKVVLRWGSPLTVISLVSPALYLVSRIVMIVEVFATLSAENLEIYGTR